MEIKEFILKCNEIFFCLGCTWIVYGFKWVIQMDKNFNL